MMLFCLQHLYVSLSEIQIKREEELTRNPLSKVKYCLMKDILISHN